MARTTWKLSKSEDTPLALYRKLVKTEEKKESRWKYMALISFGCLVLSIITLVYQSTLPRTVPLVVTVSDFGEAKYVGDVSNYSYSNIVIPEECYNYQLRKYITNLYSISADSTVLRNNLKDCYSTLTRESAQKLTEMLKSENPMKVFGEVLRNVEIESILKQTSKTYQVEFWVKTTDMSGVVRTNERMRGLFTIKVMSPSKEDLQYNPLGIYITNFDFTKLSSREK